MAYNVSFISKPGSNGGLLFLNYVDISDCTQSNNLLAQPRHEINAPFLSVVDMDICEKNHIENLDNPRMEKSVSVTRIYMFRNEENSPCIVPCRKLPSIQL